ncbi:MAG: transposase [Deltaproteobacteria bacterium]|nr:transposase [Deltaproteobacteria bacterium]
MPGVGRVTAITFARRVSRVERFPRSRQLGQPALGLMRRALARSVDDRRS